MSVSALSSIASSATTAAPTTQDRAALEKAAKAFEAVFARQLLGSMRKASLGDDITGSSAVEQFQEMSDARTADSLSDRGGLGIAEMLLTQLGGKDKTTGATIAAAGKGTYK